MARQLLGKEGIWETPEAQKCFEIVAKLASYTNPITWSLFSQPESG